MKPKLVFYGAVDTFSGYGSRARDLVKVLIKSGKYDVRIISCKWGATSSGFLNPNNPEHTQILDRILPNNQLTYQPDVFIMNTIPNEFQPIGKFNIGVTAGIETTVCDPSWIEGLNRMNLNLVSSEHAKQVFENSKFEARNQQTGQVEKIIELTSPVEVLFEGADINIYKKLDTLSENDLTKTLDTIPEKFAFLFVGHWLQGALGEDRKNVGMMIKTFLETFKNVKDKPALVIKTQGATASIIDKNEMLDKIRQIQALVDSKDLPNIYLLHGMFDDDEVNMLYNHPKVKAHVTFTKGEGFGRPLLEASISAKPVIAPNWSGHIDFLHKDMSVLLSGQLTQLHPSAVVANMLLPESGWFTVDYKAASDKMRDVYKNYKNYIDGAKRQAYRSRTEFTLDKMGEKLDSIIDPKIPKLVEIKLPQLRKIELPKIKKTEINEGTTN
jgi:glycosyltransferase involved in cell wall biosynthesis